MRLEKIKLAGFKSFVDPTQVPIPSNLVGIVGPNGCGKSNVIDAVRWVMGESSAKHLRGESMSDVIFNGSTSRKPVGQAGIELVFDNADGSAGGQYAQYAQISVKRQVSRDGQSVYLLNGVRCRRRDITDLFLGTGLGPRSYSIIEQGTISRIIEARPEDLRAFLEEAAGISKYKERRRETENRMRHTRENLDRLDDVIEEVEKQIRRLERQAATAEKYRMLKERERKIQAELFLLRWRELEQELEQRERNLAEQETALEAAVARQRRLESEIEQKRHDHTESSDAFNEVQARFYAAGSEIARLEQAIRFGEEGRERLQRDLQETLDTLEEVTGHQAQDRQRLDELEAALADEEPGLEGLREQEAEAADRLEQTQAELQQWQSAWDDFNQRSVEPAQAAQVERTRLNHLEQKERETAQRLGRMEQELAQAEDPELESELEALSVQEEELQARVEELEASDGETEEGIRSARANNETLGRQFNETRSRLSQAQGRRSSLEALQEAALGKKQKAMVQWLEQQGLTQARRLAELIQVEAPWQRAVEVVLGIHLQAVGVEAFDDLAARLGDLNEGALALFDLTRTEAPNAAPDSLAARVTAPPAIGHLLAGIRTAEHLQQALERRSTLGSGESLITPDGLWIGPNWMRLERGIGESSGVLEREEELRTLSAEIEELETAAAEIAEALEAGRETLRQAEARRDELRAALDGANRDLSALRSGLGAKRTRLEHLSARRERLQGDMEELRAQREDDLESAEEARERLHDALEQVETLAEQREGLASRRETLRNQVEAAQAEVNRLRRETQELALRVEGRRTSRDSLRENLERMTGRLGQLKARHAELEQGMRAGTTPLAEQRETLEQQLQRRVQIEAELSRARQGLEEIDQQVRALEQQRAEVERRVQQQRETLDQGRMQRHETLIRCKTLEERFNEGGFDRKETEAGLSAEAAVQTWEEELVQLDASIRRLGAINLAAIDEFREQSERMTYLSDQRADVLGSLETLEDAIRKIDRETRTRFKETFDKVDAGVKEKFPKLFGGGHAYLQLTGEDLLDTGVSVMARPPGKRNASIHLLSGGEKALTAVALVFAIFELNPAPFCMLDEVDAPLDDANVGRFCELVKSMSDRVQFIIITHNKITMEATNQLMGVTMHEPGVSRLVSVDVNEAVDLAAV